jgi:hypothetical protein
MDRTISCFVDAGGNVSVADATESAGVGPTHTFDLATRRLLTESGGAASDRAARAFFDQYVGDPARLMKYAADGHLPKSSLVNLLIAEQRRAYLDACAVIERKYTDACAAKNDPCLATGCAVEGETCLEPLLSAEPDYNKACAAEWIKLFKTPGNRIASWRN